MDNLNLPNRLIYFNNKILDSTIGFSINKNLQPIMWFKENGGNITISKLVTKSIDAQFPEYSNCDKYVVKFREYSSSCMCATITSKYITIITVNTDSEYKATYKLHLYKYKNSISKFDDMGVYYSYYS